MNSVYKYWFSSDGIKEHLRCRQAYLEGADKCTEPYCQLVGKVLKLKIEDQVTEQEYTNLVGMLSSDNQNDVDLALQLIENYDNRTEDS